MKKKHKMKKDKKKLFTFLEGKKGTKKKFNCAKHESGTERALGITK